MLEFSPNIDDPVAPPSYKKKKKFTQPHTIILIYNNVMMSSANILYMYLLTLKSF